MNLIQGQLLQAGEPSPVTPELLRLDGYRITSDTELPAEEFLFRLFGVPCFPRRDLTTVTGMEKCGKTFFSSMLMACCAERRVLELERIREQPLRVLWYDTEQSQQSTHNILKNRVAGLVTSTPFPEEHFFVFNVRSCSYKERMEMLITAIATFRPDLVIVDNISDLLPSINDAESSVTTIDQLMQLAAEYDCNITVVIHLNRSGEKRNLRGWLGTELLHKSFEVYYCERIYGTKVFSVEQTMTRQSDIDAVLYYEVTEEGLPKTTKKPNIQPRDAQGKFMSTRAEAYQVTSDKMATFNQDYIIRHPEDAQHPWEWDLHRLFADAMGNRASVGQDELMKCVMERSHILQQKYYDKVLKMAIERRVVMTTMDRNGRVVVIMP